jgi:hypothetical protein
MTRRQLQQICKPELIEIIVQHQQIIHQQQALIEGVHAHLNRLEAQINRLEGATDRLSSSVALAMDQLTGLHQSDSCEKNHSWALTTLAQLVIIPDSKGLKGLVPLVYRLLPLTRRYLLCPSSVGDAGRTCRVSSST